MNARMFPLALLLLALPAASHAWPMLHVTATEVVSVDPPRWKTTFTITEEGYGQCWGWFIVQAGDAASPEAPTFYGCEASVPWECTAYGTPTTLLHFDPYELNPFLPATFSIVTDRASPCVRIRFDCPLLGASPPPPIEACLSTDLPVPAVSMSWGRLKTQYR